MAQPAFTPKMVKELLRNKILKGAALRRTSMLKLSSAAYVLAGYLNFLRWRAQNWIGPWKTHHDERELGVKAIVWLTKIYPSHRESLAAEICAMEQWENAPARSVREATAAKLGIPCGPDFKDGLAKLRADLAAMDALIAAAWVARERGLPLAHPMNVTSPAAELWPDIAEDLQKMLLAVLPAAGLEASYHFIEAVVPTITGEKPTYPAVKTAFVMKRLPPPHTRFSGAFSGGDYRCW